MEMYVNFSCNEKGCNFFVHTMNPHDSCDIFILDGGEL